MPSEAPDAPPRERVPFEPDRRVHGWSWVFGTIVLSKQMIVPLIAVVVIGSDDNRAWTGAALLVAIAMVALWRQHVYRYGFSPSGLVIHEGLLFRKVRQIEYQRIENIDTERGPLHRLLGVAQVRVETATGGEPEALIRVLSSDAVDEMRERIFPATGARPASAGAPPANGHSPPLLHLPPAELVRFGLIDNRGMVLVFAVAGVMQQAGLFRRLGERVPGWLDFVEWQQVGELGTAVQVSLGLATVLMLLLAVRALSVGLALVTLYDFTLTRHHGDLRLRYGLLTRVAATLRLPRVQAVHQSETLLHRWFGRVSLRVDMAGGAGGQQGEGADLRESWLAPVCDPARARALCRAVLPAAAPAEEPDWRGLAPGARGRVFRITLLVLVLVLAVPAVWICGRWAVLWLPAAVALSWVRAHKYVEHTRWALTPAAICFKRGWLTRRLVIAPRDRVQSAVLTESPFDRRSGMASVAVDTAGTPRSRHICIRYLDEGAARALERELGRIRPWPPGGGAHTMHGFPDPAGRS